MLKPWTTLPDNSMEAVIGNNLPAFNPTQCQQVASEAYRVLQPGGQMRVWTQAGPASTMKAAMIAAGFQDVFTKDLTVIGTK